MAFNGRSGTNPIGLGVVVTVRMLAQGYSRAL